MNNPEAMLLEAMVVGTTQMVENQERRGAQEMARSERLPKRVNGGTREQLKALGIQFGNDIDELFVFVTLPEGWRIERTDHSLYTRLVDDRGRERATIFYKAAFYDRDAFMSLTRRYNAKFVPRDEDANGLGYYVPSDWGQPISNAPRISGYGAAEKAIAWLDEHFPQHKDPLAYLEE